MSCSSATRALGSKEINIVLVGKTGNGKSSTGNTILRRDVFLTSDSSSSLTKLASLECSKCEETSSVVNVVDTPGLMDTDDDDSLTIIGQAMSLCPSGFNAVVVVVQYGNIFTREEEACIDILKQYLGRRFLKDCGIIIMTHGDSFDLNNKNSRFSDWCREENQDTRLGQLLAECRGRCVLFYNKGKKYEEKRERCFVELMDIIRTEIPRRYRSSNFDAAVVTRSIILEENKMPVLDTMVQENISLMDELLYKDITSDTISLENMKNSARELHKAINNLPDSPELEQLKAQVQSITDKIEDLKVEPDTEKRTAIQRQMKKDLRIVKNPPSKSHVIIANIKLIFAKVAYPVGTVFTLGLTAAFLRNLVFEKKIDYEVEVRLFERRKKQYAEEKGRVSKQ